MSRVIPLLPIYAFMACTGTTLSIKKKPVPVIIFCIFYLSSPLHCTVVSVETGAGFW